MGFGTRSSGHLASLRITVVVSLAGAFLAAPQVAPVAGIDGMSNPTAQAATPVRIRRDLDTGNLYTYANDPAATTRILDQPVAGLSNDTWLDLSHPANNIAASSSDYCLAVNRSGVTVYVNQDGPVLSCENPVPTARALVGEQRVLTEPAVTPSPSTLTPTIGDTFTLQTTGTNRIRQEWLLPDGTTSTQAQLSSLNATNTDPLTYSVRAVGTKGERLHSTTVIPQGFSVTVQIAGRRGSAGSGGGLGVSPSATCNPYVTYYPGLIGSYGGSVTGQYTITSLPATFSISAVAGTTSTQLSGGPSFNITSPVTCTAYPSTQTGGSAGPATQISLGATMIAKARGGAGGSSGTYAWNGGTPKSRHYGASTSGSNLTSAGLLTSVVYGTSNQDAHYARITLPGGQFAEKSAVGTTITVSDLTSIS